ncbi:hypothetical protein QIS74_07265 [Colletotrichum tabaci]|uniref:Uncharacterized protein n=1 Tax=Colletotrichum tabaci TaxID=1209068 RepID=A0AAV9TAS5_9PEZI
MDYFFQLLRVEELEWARNELLVMLAAMPEGDDEEKHNRIFHVLRILSKDKPELVARPPYSSLQRQIKFLR